ncbi:MAG TPA: RNA-splicing ligase RtcB [Planctomycetaceae bacterium]|nr:RNA-splicing ligase RtcB [Planctomycetaceae bacterium]
MNTSQLKKLGVPESCVTFAIQGIQSIAQTGEMRGAQLKEFIRQVIDDPNSHLADPHFALLARELISEQQYSPPEPATYQTWGTEIDQAAHVQMRQSCAVPVSRRGALMPDAHVGYGLPIGGVLACENAVIPYAVGVDIACRMKLSVFDLPPSALNDRHDMFATALEKGTCFGVGGHHQRRQNHPVLDLDWNVSRVTRENKDKAWKQLGSSGSGNHFVEFGVLSLTEPAADLGLAAGEYVALLSHSGSRGTGASVCSTYSAIAQARLPKRYTELGRLAWLDLDSEAGQEYWEAMNLMGEYAAANHEVIHRLVANLIGCEAVAGVENHHNFAWKEIHDGRELIVHRKGATPAGLGVLGVIPGSMADPGYVVRGKGNEASLRSASHGAGRAMSRTKAKENYTWKAVQNDLKKKGITVLSAGADEVPYAYKRIDQVMAQQLDLVDIVARFDPRIVKMCGDGSAAED